MKYCTECGTAIDGQKKFCTECGVELGERAASVQPQADAKSPADAELGAGGPALKRPFTTIDPDADKTQRGRLRVLVPLCLLGVVLAVFVGYRVHESRVRVPDGIVPVVLSVGAALTEGDVDVLEREVLDFKTYALLLYADADSTAIPGDDAEVIERVKKAVRSGVLEAFGSAFTALASLNDWLGVSDDGLRACGVVTSDGDKRRIATFVNIDGEWKFAYLTPAMNDSARAEYLAALKAGTGSMHGVPDFAETMAIAGIEFERTTVADTAIDAKSAMEPIVRIENPSDMVLYEELREAFFSGLGAGFIGDDDVYKTGLSAAGIALEGDEHAVMLIWVASREHGHAWPLASFRRSGDSWSPLAYAVVDSHTSAARLSQDLSISEALASAVVQAGMTERSAESEWRISSHGQASQPGSVGQPMWVIVFAHEPSREAAEATAELFAKEDAEGWGNSRPSSDAFLVDEASHYDGIDGDGWVVLYAWSSETEDSVMTSLGARGGPLAHISASDWYTAEVSKTCSCPGPEASW